MRKLSLILALLLALCSFALAETPEAAVAAEDFQGIWNLQYAVADGIQVSTAAYGLTVVLTLNEDGSALLDYGDGSAIQMSWRFEENEAWLTGYSEADVQMVIAEDGSMNIEDEVGLMHFVRPVEETEGK